MKKKDPNNEKLGVTINKVIKERSKKNCSRSLYCNLHAAAPEMLKILKMCEKNWPVWMGTPEDKKDLNKIQAVIAKAEGRA